MTTITDKAKLYFKKSFINAFVGIKDEYFFKKYKMLIKHAHNAEEDRFLNIILNMIVSDANDMAYIFTRSGLRSLKYYVAMFWEDMFGYDSDMAKKITNEHMAKELGQIDLYVIRSPINAINSMISCTTLLAERVEYKEALADAMPYLDFSFFDISKDKDIILANARNEWIKENPDYKFMGVNDAFFHADSIKPPYYISHPNPNINFMHNYIFGYLLIFGVCPFTGLKYNSEDKYIDFCDDLEDLILVTQSSCIVNNVEYIRPEEQDINFHGSVEDIEIYIKILDQCVNKYIKLIAPYKSIVEGVDNILKKVGIEEQSSEEIASDAERLEQMREKVKSLVLYKEQHTNSISTKDILQKNIEDASVKIYSYTEQMNFRQPEFEIVFKKGEL